MAFAGHSAQHFIHSNSLTFHTVDVIVVSGDFPNPCGHTLLRIDNYIFHISGWYNYPKYMALTEFNQYLKDNNKTELFRNRRYLKNKLGARQKLKTTLQVKWPWLLLPNNCTAFVEDILIAGENNFSLASNCPVLISIMIRRQMSVYGAKARKITK